MSVVRAPLAAGLLAALLLAALPAAAAAACAGTDRVPATRADAADAARAVRCLVGEARARHGRRALRPSALLNGIAHAHARDMVRRRYFSHTSPDGREPAARAAARGAARLGLRWIGENLAWATPGRATARAVVRRWLASPAHRATMLDPRFRLVGVAAVRGTPRPRWPHGFTFALELGG